MNSQNFDEQLRQQMNEGELAYQPQLWTQLHHRLDEQSFDAALCQKMDDATFEYNPASWMALSNQLQPNSFDDTLRQKINEDALPYNHAHWQQLLSKLSSKRINFIPKHRFARVAAVAAACLLAVSAVALFWNQFDTKPQVSLAPTIAQESLSTPTNKNTIAADTQTNEAVVANNSNVANTHKPASLVQTKSTNSTTTTTNNNLLQGVVNPTSTEQSVQNILVQKNNNTVAKETPKDVFQPSTQPKSSSIVAYQPLINDYNSNYYLENHNRDEAKTSIAIGTGVSYGNFKTGITVGVGVRQYLSKDVFFDGVVAMNINQGNERMLNTTGSAKAILMSSKSTSGSSKTNAAVITNARDFYYLQVNPTFGLRLNKKFAISAGPDFQQRIRENSDETVIITKSQGAKIIPFTDIGLTGKAEVNLTRDIQTGIMYREGINSFFRGSDYLNRRYMQVQLKYNIPVKR